jgi:hypothetical protein
MRNSPDTSSLAFWHQCLSAPRLDKKQVGHIRHIENLARQLPGDWSHMGSKIWGQEDFGAYRYQLAYMAYAIGLAHFHRLPAAPGAFRDTFDRLIQKMLHPDVWMYWRNVSQGGSPFNAHLRPILHELWDPVQTDNIMYSAYVQSLTLMYNFLFNDKKYSHSGSIRFWHQSFFWGDGEKIFEYDQNTLNEHLYWQMVRSGYVGIACEPNCVFQICNQPAIIGFRLHDILNGGDRAAEVTRGYQEAWSTLGQLGENGHYNMLVLEDSKTVIPNATSTAWIDGWCGTLMNAWNRDFVKGNYGRQIQDLLYNGPDGTLSVNPSEMLQIGDLSIDYDVADFGFIATWASEMGDTETLNGLHSFADRFMKPTWSRGGYYYPRNDDRFDEQGLPVRVEPITGNALIAYSRLNVPDGMWGIYNNPWSEEHFDEPAVTDVTTNADILRAWFDSKTNSLTVTVSPRECPAGNAVLRFDKIWGRGSWQLYQENALVGSGDAHRITSCSTNIGLLRHGEEITLSFLLTEEISFVFYWKSGEY